MGDVKWIKVSTGIRHNRKIKQIRRLPEGDTIALMWFYIMCLAGEVNENGLIYFTPEIPYTDEMLSDEFDMDINTVRLGLKTFERFGMIEIIDNIIHLSSWEKWQSVDRLSEIREYNRLAKQRSRAKAKIEQKNVNDMSMTSQRCHDTDIDIDKDIDKELYISIVEYLNQKAGTKYKPTTQKTQSYINARLSEGFSVDDFKTVIDKKCAEWLGSDMEKFLRPETLFGTKFESYLNAKLCKPNQGKGKNTRFNSFEQRSYNYGYLERELMNSQNPKPTAGTDDNIRKRAEDLQKKLGAS